jgi:hypothetical protein
MLADDRRDSHSRAYGLPQPPCDSADLELQGQLEQFQRSHADAMAEMSRIQAAEREAAALRIRELEANLEAHQQAHADAMAEMNRILAAEREAATARIRELEGDTARLKPLHSSA